MKRVPTGILYSPADCWSPAWKTVFGIFVKPMRLIVGMRDKLTTDFRQKPPALDFWLNDLQNYNRLLSAHRDQMDETLAKLDSVAPITWDVGHEIRESVQATYSAVAGAGVFFRGNISFKPGERDAQIMDIRRRVFESSKKFFERPLLESLRTAVTAEQSIPLEQAWLNADETNAYMGIVVPAARVESNDTHASAIEGRVRRATDNGADHDRVNEERTPKRKRGRKPDTDPKADKRIVDAWATGHFKTYEECGNALQKTKNEVKRAIDRDRKRRPNKRHKRS